MARCLPSGPLTSRIENVPSTLTGRTVKVAVGRRRHLHENAIVQQRAGAEAALHVVAHQHELLDAGLLKAGQDVAANANRLAVELLDLVGQQRRDRKDRPFSARA